MDGTAAASASAGDDEAEAGGLPGGATLPVLGEAAFADWRRGLGERVLERRGQHWVEPRPGFWQPVHLLARLSAAEAARPPTPLR